MKKTAGIALVCVETCRVLFLLKAVGKSLGLWGFPGGTMDDGETYEETMYRETEEETGIGRSSISNVRYLTDISTSKKIFKLYIGEISSEVVPVLSDEHSDYAWLSLETLGGLESLPIKPSNLELLPHICDHVECRVRDIDENYHVLKLGFRRHIR